VLDGDLQDPPEILPAFLNKLAEGYDVVYAIRRSRKENIVLRLLYWSFYRLLAALTPIRRPLDTGDFGLMTRRVVEALRTMPERRRFVRGMRSYVGFRQTGLVYERQQRAGGSSKYSFRKLLALAADGVFTFSEAPLRLATVLGLSAAGLALAIGAYMFVWRIFSGQQLPGFATLAVGLFFLGGIQLICLGILGEYIGRIHHEVKQRPAYIIDRVEGATHSPSHLPNVAALERKSPGGVGVTASAGGTSSEAEQTVSTQERGAQLRLAGVVPDRTSAASKRLEGRSELPGQQAG
jgi:dolichol-phosphate mannosyltransferase